MIEWLLDKVRGDGDTSQNVHTVIQKPVADKTQVRISRSSVSRTIATTRNSKSKTFSTPQNKTPLINSSDYEGTVNNWLLSKDDIEVEELEYEAFLKYSKESEAS